MVQTLKYNRTLRHPRPVTDTDQPETGNDEFEYLGEWTPAKRIRLKSRPLLQSKRSRETPTDLEHMESDELQRIGTGSRANKRESDQPEETTVKEQRVDDIAMDQGSQDASMIKMTMDGSGHGCVMWGFTRLCGRGKV